MLFQRCHVRNGPGAACVPEGAAQSAGIAVHSDNCGFPAARVTELPRLRGQRIPRVLGAAEWSEPCACSCPPLGPSGGHWSLLLLPLPPEKAEMTMNE